MMLLSMRIAVGNGGVGWGEAEKKAVVGANFMFSANRAGPCSLDPGVSACVSCRVTSSSINRETGIGSANRNFIHLSIYSSCHLERWKMKPRLCVRWSVHFRGVLSDC